MRTLRTLGLMLVLCAATHAANVQFIGNGCLTGSTTCTITLNQATGTGNLLLFSFATTSGPAATPCTDSAGETYTVIDTTPLTTMCYVSPSVSGVTTITAHALASTAFTIIFEEWSPTGGKHYVIDQNPGVANCSTTSYSSKTTGTQSQVLDLVYGVVAVGQTGTSGIGPLNTPPTWASLVNTGGSGLTMFEAHASSNNTNPVTISGTNTTGLSVCANVFTFQNVSSTSPSGNARRSPGVF